MPAVLFLASADSEPVSDIGMQGTTTGLTDLTLVDCSSLQNRGLVRAALLPLHARTLQDQVPYELHSAGQ